jgi:putative flippase GtrA
MKEFLSLFFPFQKEALFLEPTENGFVQFFRFVFVGGIATVVDVAVVTLSYEVWGLQAAALTFLGFDAGALLAGTLGFLVGLTVNYLLSIVWIFRNSNINRVREFLSFALIGVVGLFIKLLCVGTLERFVFDLNDSFLGIIPMVTIVSCIATVVAFVWNFVAKKFILYSGKNRERLKK